MIICVIKEMNNSLHFKRQLMKIKSNNVLIITCSRVTPSDLSIPTCSPNTASLMVALYLLCSGKRTQQPNSRSPKDTASYWVKRAVYKSWKEARPGGGTFRSKESSLDRLEMEDIWFDWSLATFLCAQFGFFTIRAKISNIFQTWSAVCTDPRSVSEQASPGTSRWNTGTHRTGGPAWRREGLPTHDEMCWRLITVTNIMSYSLTETH